MLNAFHILIPTTALGSVHHYVHFTDLETEGQKGPMSHN